MNYKNFQENVFSLFQLLKRLNDNNNLCCAFFFRGHIFGLIMRLFANQSPQILKTLVISGFLFSFICLEGIRRWSQSVSTKWRQLQFTYCISIKHDFLELSDSWFIIHFCSGKVKRESQANSGFSAACIMQSSDGKKELSISFLW